MIEPQVAATDGQVTFTVNLPGDLASRAPYGDGLSATQLHYTIYEVDAQGALDPVSTTELKATFANGSLSTTIQPALVRGRKYQLLFWADAPQNGTYTFSPANKNVTVDYTALKAKANTDAADGFFGASDVITIVNTAVDQTVTLTRPFAQLNVGTNDLTEPTVVKAYGAALANLTTGVKVSTNSLFYNTLSLVDGAVSGTVNDITFDTVAPAGEFPVSSYSNLSMDYLLVDPTQIESTVELTFNDGTNDHVVSVTNVPLQRNYRTNIYGSLLTISPTFTVTKDPIFSGENLVTTKTWDGVTRTQPTITVATADEPAKIQINTPEELAWVSDPANFDEIKDAEITLAANTNYDWNGHNWNPIGKVATGGQYDAFTGKLIGNNATISNVKIETADQVIGLFNVVGNNAEITGLNVENATIHSTAALCYYAGGIIGILEPSNYTGTVKISDCTFSGTISGLFMQLGGIISGYTTQGGLEITNCTNNGNLSGGAYIGGICGMYMQINGHGKITGCVNNGTIDGTNSENFGYAAGGIIGGATQLDISNCINTGVVKGYSKVGGIVGDVSKSTLSGNSNFGQLTALNASTVIGEIIGKINYEVNLSLNPTTNTEMSVGKVRQILNILSGELVGTPAGDSNGKLVFSSTASWNVDASAAGATYLYANNTWTKQ